MKRNVYTIIDGQAGSSGKGKVIGQMAIDKKMELAITNNMPNAGRTFVENGIKRVFRNIPVSAVNPNTVLFLGPESIIDMDTLVMEYEQNRDILDGREIIAHPLIPLVQKEHIEREKRELKFGSTFKGCAACKCDKIMRRPDLKFFEGYKSIKVLSDRDYYNKLFHYLETMKKILVESAQGSNLDINHSGLYPYVTSRQVSVEQILADAAISSKQLKSTTMLIRTFPIRISNMIYDGSSIFSGGYGSSEELTWEQISVGAFLGQYPTVITEDDLEEYSDIKNDFCEYTTVTKQKRRVFDISVELLKRSVYLNHPDEVYLNFFQYLDSEYENVHGKYDGINGIYFDNYRSEYIAWLEDVIGAPINFLGTGEEYRHFIDRRPYVRALRKR